MFWLPPQCIFNVVVAVNTLLTGSGRLQLQVIEAQGQAQMYTAQISMQCLLAAAAIKARHNQLYRCLSTVRPGLCEVGSC